MGSEYTQALKAKANAAHHRKLQATILYAEGMSLVKARESTGFVHQTVRNLSNRYLAQGLSIILKEYRYCYGAVDAHSGDSFFIIAGGCNSDWMNAFLRQLSSAYPDDYIILVKDNAVWHKAQSLQIPANITFAFIPPYTPEMNPIEQVWAEIRKRGFKNKAFKSLLAVMDQLEEVIRGLTAECLKSIVNRQWTNAIFGV